MLYTINRQYSQFFNAVRCCTGTELTDHEQYLVMEYLQVRRLRKRQYFVQEGDVCRYMAFITHGAVRTYAVNQKGEEAIHYFSTEGDWLGDRLSFSTGSPCRYHMEALEHTELLIGSAAALDALVTEVPAIQLFLEQDQYRQLALGQARLNTVLSMNAEERYADLVMHQPAYIQRFPQHMIACYLGITPETLSRIRKHRGHVRLAGTGL